MRKLNTMPNQNFSSAKKAQEDEFYTQYPDIQKEINAYLEYNPDVFRNKTVLLPCDDPEWSNFTKFFAQNFENFGLKKLISTSFAIESKKYKMDWQPTLFETENPLFNLDKSKRCGKIFVLDHDTNANGKIDIEDLQWQYLEGDGDFRSDEVKKLRDEADIIVTNPPFSLFREFLAWLIEGKNKFLVMGNSNVVTYKWIFPLIKDNKLWFGNHSGHTLFAVPENAKIPDFYDLNDTQKLNANGYKMINGKLWRNLGNICWFTNIDHGRRHQPLQLMSKADNLKFSKHKDDEKWNVAYLKYDNYDAIEVPFYDAIPSDYDGVMGVPISFLDKYCPEQFEIVGLGNSRENFTPNKDYINPKKVKKDGKIVNGGAINCVLTIELEKQPHDTVYYISDNSKYLISPYARILIRKVQ